VGELEFPLYFYTVTVGMQFVSVLAHSIWRLRDVFTTRHYTNPRLPYLSWRGRVEGSSQAITVSPEVNVLSHWDKLLRNGVNTAQLRQ